VLRSFLRHRLLVAIVAVSVAVAALLLIANTGPSPNITNGDGPDNPRYYHCAELARIQSRWYSYPKSDMWERIDRRYKRECPDYGLEVRDDIFWTADLPPEPPDEP
jgi:hypothetical protein